jgi:hypothetical protein
MFKSFLQENFGNQSWEKGSRSISRDVNLLFSRLSASVLLQVFLRGEVCSVTPKNKTYLYCQRKKYAGGYKSGILGKIGVIFESIRTRTHQLPTTPQTLTNKMGTQPKRKKQRSSWGKDPSVPGRPYSFDSMNWGGRDSRYTRIMLFSSMMFVELFFKLLLLFGAVQQKMMPVPYSIRMPATPM